VLATKRKNGIATPPRVVKKVYESLIMFFIEGLSLLSRLLIGFVMLIAGILKLRAGFAWSKQTLSSYIQLPPLILNGMVWLLPLLEVGLGTALIVGFLTPHMVFVAFVLLLGFSLVTLYAILKGRDHDCGCFGKIRLKQHGGPTIIYRNTVLMGMLLLPLSTKPLFSLDNLSHMSSTAMPRSILTISLIIYVLWLPIILWFSRYQSLHKIG